MADHRLPQHNFRLEKSRVSLNIAPSPACPYLSCIMVTVVDTSAPDIDRHKGRFKSSYLHVLYSWGDRSATRHTRGYIHPAHLPEHFTCQHDIDFFGCQLDGCGYHRRYSPPCHKPINLSENASPSGSPAHTCDFAWLSLIYFGLADVVAATSKSVIWRTISHGGKGTAGRPCYQAGGKLFALKPISCLGLACNIKFSSGTRKFMLFPV